MKRNIFLKILAFSILWLYACTKADAPIENLVLDKDGSYVNPDGCEEYVVDTYERWCTYEGNVAVYCTGWMLVNSTVVNTCVEGGGGYGNGSNNNPDEPDGLSCSSFNFVRTTSNWQEAAVYDVRLKIVFYDASTNSYRTTKISLGTQNRPLWFGLPVTRYDGTAYTAGQAAELAAECVQNAADVVTSLFVNNPSVTPQQLQSEYLKQIKNFMLSYGGRCDYNGSGSSSVVPKKAQYNFFGTGDCD